MLRTLSIKNYALIDNLQVDFDKGFTIITGETGAGKSILLGGLSLVLGKRADLSSLRDKEQKCVIEAVFDVSEYKLERFFRSEDLDYEASTIIRREILPSGKSRAFINDTPVTLDVLSSLGNRLIDIHSQHQTLQLTDNTFQFKIVDAVAGTKILLRDYKKVLSEYFGTKKELQKLIDYQEEANKEHDYNTFLLKELDEANLKPGMLAELEAQYEQLNNIEEIGERLAYASQLLNEDQIGIVNSLSELKAVLSKLSSYGIRYEELFNRVNSVFIELDDASTELIGLQEALDPDPSLLETVSTKLQQIYDLQKKHNAADILEILEIHDALRVKVQQTENLESDIKEKQLKVLELEKNLDAFALNIHDKRVAIIPELTAYLENALHMLGMQNASFKIEVIASSSYLSNGKDQLNFLFAANKGTDYDELKKVASGGELSRIMLSIKALLAKHTQLPTIMFDEIDTGVSGEISNKMGDIMKEMSRRMQVFAITHLPQVAAKGNAHFKVYKYDESGVTHTSLRKLTAEDRVKEIAEMLGGKDISSSAMEHAKQLLN